MSEQEPPGTGRARGRARGRPKPQENDGAPGQAARQDSGQHQQMTEQMSRVNIQGDRGDRGSSRGGSAWSAPRGGGGQGSARGGRGGADRGGSFRGGGGRGGGDRGRGGGRGGNRGGRGGRMERGRKRGSVFDEYKISITRPEHVTASKSGQEGSSFTMMSNHAAVNVAEVAKLYQYHVDFFPDIEKIKWKHQMLSNEHREMFGNLRPIFDGMKCTARVKFDQNPMEVFSNHPETGEKVRITLKFINELPVNSPEFLHITNVMFRNFLMKNLKMVQIGRNYYSMQVGRAPIPQYRIDVLSGFETSILQFENGLNLELDISHKVLRSETALDVIADIQGKARGRDERGIKADIFKALVGAVVMTRYNNKTYRVSDIDYNTRPTSTFETRDGPITYTEYFTKQYGAKNLDPGQPMLVIRPKEKDRRSGVQGNIYLPPQLCFMTGLTDDMRMNFKVMQDVARHTRIGPAERYQKLVNFLQETNNMPEAQEEFGAYGYKFAEKLLPVQARTIQNVKLRMGKGEFGYNQAEADWTNGMRGQTCLTVIPIKQWCVICDQRNKDTASQFVNAMRQVCRGLGVQLAEPNLVVVPNPRDEVIIQAVKQNIFPQLDLMVVILPTSKKSLYDGIKKVCCIEMPVSSQCIQAKTLNKPKGLMSVVTKVGMQIQCKLGGELWQVITPKLPAIMIVGVDTYHDASTGRSREGKRSAVGCCASMTMGMTKYYSEANFQSRQEEVVNGLGVFFNKAIRRYHDINGITPTHIFVYRDGVGDGQLDVVVSHEIKQIDDAFVKMNIPPPKVTYTIVKKRINTRFFAKVSGQVANPLPGTIVDNTVTRPEWYDFFLVSQSVRQGTVSPTHYNVIRDDSKWPVDRIQKLTYWLTHLYYNWPGTIRVPAPCQYAHKMAFLHGQSLHKPAALELSERLYFL